MPSYRQQYDWMEKINKEGVNLNEWELDFMRRISFLLLHNYQLTEKQIRYLEQIYAERTP